MFDFSEISNAISEYAPILSSIISTASPPAGLVISLIARAIGAREDDPKDILEKIKTQPNAMEEIKRIESEHQNQVADEIPDIEKAREREEQFVKETKKRDATMTWVLAITVISSASLLMLLLFAHLSSFNKDIVKNILYWMIEKLLKIVDYYY